MGSIEEAKARLEEATRELADVSVRTTFGAPAFYAGGAMFAMVSRAEARIGVKLPDEASRASLLGIEGAVRWAPNGRSMGAWVLVPETWDLAELRPWVRRAYEQVLRARSEAEGPAMPAKLRATKTKKKDETAIAVLHDGATRAHRVEKPGTKTAAAPARAKRTRGR